jgi:hypothetical protein
VTPLEFWPDCGSGPLWTEEGQSVDPRSLGLAEELVEQLQEWNGWYRNELVEIDALRMAEDTGARRHNRHVDRMQQA